MTHSHLDTGTHSPRPTCRFERSPPPSTHRTTLFIFQLDPHTIELYHEISYRTSYLCPGRFIRLELELELDPALRDRNRGTARSPLYRAHEPTQGRLVHERKPQRAQVRVQ
jgi:hypothetical protein